MTIKTLLEYVVWGISGFSILIAIWGVVLVAVYFFKGEFTAHTKSEKIKKNTTIKNDLASYILLSFEILIAADVILSIIRPTLKDIAILATLVVIRTFITHFLNKELDAFQNHKKEEN